MLKKVNVIGLKELYSFIFNPKTKYIEIEYHFIRDSFPAYFHYIQ